VKNENATNPAADPVEKVPQGYAVTPLGAEEIDRRYRHVANRARRDLRGRLVCRFCERMFAHPRSLRAHLARKHQDAIAGGTPEDYAP
jgi:hypothetical protein